MATKRRLTDAVVKGLTADPEAAAKGNDTLIWDKSLTGFGLKVTPTGAMSYIYSYRHGGKKRRLTFGSADKINASAARAMAEKAQTASRAGRDPQAEKMEARAAQTIKELSEQWLATLHAKARRDEMSQRTVDDYASKLTLHIVPVFGSKKPAALTADDIKAWRDKVSAKAEKDIGKRPLGNEGMKGVLRVLSAFCSYLKEAKVITTNPAAGLGQFKTKEVQRYLTVEESARLGATLDKWRERMPHWVAIIELAALTGARKEELLTLRWDAVDEERGCMVLKEHKTKRTSGAKTIYLGADALSVLERAKTWKRAGNPYVFPSQAHRNVALVRSGKTPKIEDMRRPMSKGGLKRQWTAMRKEAGLKDGDARLRFHDLRHSFAATAVSNGVSLPVLGKNLGHSSVQTTSRYAHIHDAAAHAAAQQTSAQIKERMSKKPADTVVLFPAKST